jgi:hypothetical protein
MTGFDLQEELAARHSAQVAARFAGSAEGDDIVVGPVTAERISSRFILEALGERTSKNIFPAAGRRPASSRPGSTAR